MGGHAYFFPFSDAIYVEFEHYLLLPSVMETLIKEILFFVSKISVTLATQLSERAFLFPDFQDVCVTMGKKHKKTITLGIGRSPTF